MLFSPPMQRYFYVKYFALQLLFLAILGGSALLLLAYPWVVVKVLAVLLLVSPVAYLFLCALFPPAIDKTCPACRQPALVPLRPGEPIGVRCTACGQVDEEHTTAYLD